MAKQPALGKGLASLLPSARQETAFEVSTGEVAAQVDAASIEQVRLPQDVNRDRLPGITVAALDDIRVNTYQPRRDFDQEAIQELAQSIRANGLIQPLIVRKTDQGYELIAGERRLRACREAGLTQVPIVVRKSTDRESLELALIENIQRQDLNCIDTALAYLQLIQDFSLTQEELSRRVGKDRASIANHIRLLKLPEDLLQDLKSGLLSFGHGKILAGLTSVDAQHHWARRVKEGGLSVRELERALKEDEGASTEAEGRPEVSSDDGHDPVKRRLRNLSSELTRAWNSKVEIKGSERRGKIVFHYETRGDLERIIEELQMVKGEAWQPKETSESQQHITN